MNKNIFDKIAWLIPIKIFRDKFRKYIEKNLYLYYLQNNKEDIIKHTEYIITNKELLTPYLLEDIEYLRYLCFSNFDSIRKTRDSKIINKYLKGLKGIEVGGSANANFAVDAIQVNIFDTDEFIESMSSVSKYGYYNQKVDLLSNGDDLPFKDNSIDFVLSSHTLEHFYDPIKTLKEWYRVIKKGGYIIAVLPHKDRTSDKSRPRTTLNELIERHNNKNYEFKFEERGQHFSVWVTEDLIELCQYLNMNVIEYLDVDDSIGNGFTIVIQK